MSTILSHFKNTFTLIGYGVYFVYGRCITSSKITKNKKRYEFILNVTLVGSISLVGMLDVFIIISILREDAHHDDILLWAFTTLFFVFIGLLVLSRKGRTPLASYMLLSLYYLSAAYCIIALILVSIGYMQVSSHITRLLYWKQKIIDIQDPAGLSILLFLIMTLSWFSNHEMEAALRRARKSEKELKEERDTLEAKVDERTKELKRVQHEKFCQLYRFAEFGRLSSGVFHDLANSINAVIANVGALEHSSGSFPEINASLSKAVAASKRMSEFIATARKQMQSTGEKTTYSVNKEIRDAINILQHKADIHELTIDFPGHEEIITFGKGLKFHQVAVNLIANAIDAYADNEHSVRRIHIALSHANGMIRLSIADSGVGINPEIMGKIFDPFFTTKAIHGIGLGLSMTKEIIEKELNGSIAVESTYGKGSVFTVMFPLIDKKENLNK